MPRPYEKLKEPVTQTTGPDQASLFRATVRIKEYRYDCDDASLRRLEADELKRRVLQKAAYEVRQHPETLALWAFRLAQHVCRGTYGYGEAWETLEVAALDAGVSQSRVTRTLYHGFADSMCFDAEVMPLTVLVSGVH